MGRSVADFFRGLFYPTANIVYVCVNLLDLYTNKTKQYLRTKTCCHLLGLNAAISKHIQLVFFFFFCVMPGKAVESSSYVN